MVILGLDPGSIKAGFACIKIDGKKISYLASGAMKFDTVDDFNQKIRVIYECCEDLVQKYSPDEISMESLVYVKNPKSLMKLAQARGAMLAAISKQCAGKIYEYSPNLVKSSVVGHGHATKEAVQKGLELMFGKLSFKSDDESDALAIAVCHAFNRRALRQKNMDGKL